MKTKFVLLLTFLCVVALLLSGCYTQLRTSHDDYDNDQYVNNQNTDQGTQGQQYQQNPDDTNAVVGDQNYNYTDNGYDNWHSPIGFSYYYPSYYWPSNAFATAWNDPWFYDSYWGSSYYPWYCGTPYIYYPRYYYPYGGYNSYNSRYDNYGGWGHRNIGTNRGVITTTNWLPPRGGDGNGYQPQPPGSTSTPIGTGVSTGNTGAARNQSFTPAKRTVRNSGTQRGYSQRNSRQGTSRGGTRVPTYVPTYRGTSSDNGSRRGDSGNSTPSLTPSPGSSSAPRSAPAPSGGSGGRSSRGGRP